MGYKTTGNYKNPILRDIDMYDMFIMSLTKLVTSPQILECGSSYNEFSTALNIVENATSAMWERKNELYEKIFPGWNDRNFYNGYNETEEKLKKIKEVIIMLGIYTIMAIVEVVLSLILFVTGSKIVCALMGTIGIIMIIFAIAEVIIIRKGL